LVASPKIKIINNISGLDSKIQGVFVCLERYGSVKEAGGGVE
jgi:hypothetical protein